VGRKKGCPPRKFNQEKTATGREKKKRKLGAFREGLEGKSFFSIISDSQRNARTPRNKRVSTRLPNTLGCPKKKNLTEGFDHIKEAGARERGGC